MGGVLIVTGSSRGIGAAIARRGAAHGYAVCVNYLARRDRADAIVGAIVEAGGRAVAIQADVGRDADVRRLFAEVDQTLGPVTALVNNVGIIGGERRVEDADPTHLAHLFAVNVIGGFLCAREAIRRMSPRYGGRGGAIVNVSSMAAKLGGFAGRVHYAASKGAVDVLTMGLAREVAGESIRVNAVRPGPTATEIHDAFGGPEFLNRVAGMLPMRRVAGPEEIAAAVLWLLSDEASFTTGATLDVAGGQ